MWRVILCCCLGVGLVAGAVEGEYSAFSGLVVSVSVGSPPQPVSVSLDFQAPNTFLFHRMACPPFVPACFWQEASVSFSADPLSMEAELGASDLGLGSSFTASEVVEFDQLAKRIDVNVVLSRLPSSARLSEVAGVLSLSPDSPLFAESLVSFHKSPVSKPHSVVITTPPSALVAELSLPSQSETSWRFAAFVGPRGAILRRADIIIDLSEQDLIVPQWMMREFVKYFLFGVSEVRDNRLFVECSPLAVPRDILEFVISFGGSRFVRLNTESLLVSGVRDSMVRTENVPNKLLCPTRVRFSLTTAVTVGEPFLESVSRLVFDFKSRRMEVFVKQTADELPQLASTGAFQVARPALIPVFKNPRVGTAEGSPFLIFDPSPSSEGLVLLNCLLQELNGVTAWRFVRTTLAVDEQSSVDIPGMFESANFLPDNGQLRFALTPVNAETRVAVKIRVQRTRRFVSVALLPVRLARHSRMLDLSLPDPHTAGPAETGRECTICLSAFQEGETLQSLSACSHEFHLNCIRPWLESSRLTCPSCRTVVAPRRASNRVAPLPTTRGGLEHDLATVRVLRRERVGEPFPVAGPAGEPEPPVQCCSVS